MNVCRYPKSNSEYVLFKNTVYNSLVSFDITNSVSTYAYSKKPILNLQTVFLFLFHFPNLDYHLLPKDFMTSLHQFLYKGNLPDSLQQIILDIARASKYTAYAIRTEETEESGNTNVQGEIQLALDDKCDQIFCSILSESERISIFASEEQENIVQINQNGEYAVAFDPLDGSSLLNTNGCVGSIFGIWKGNSFENKTGNELCAAGYIQYGPRTTFILSLEGKTHEFTLSEISEYHLSKKNIQINDQAKIFAIGNLRASAEKPAYAKVLQEFIHSGKTLRYAGGMVPDINTILCKQNGIFTYPGHSKYPNGKLRLLYECAPMAFIMENAGGKAMDEGGNNILQKPISDIHERSSIILGSKNDVEHVVSLLSHS